MPSTRPPSPALLLSCPPGSSKVTPRTCCSTPVMAQISSSWAAAVSARSEKWCWARSAIIARRAPVARSWWYAHTSTDVVRLPGPPLSTPMRRLKSPQRVGNCVEADTRTGGLARRTTRRRRSVMVCAGWGQVRGRRPCSGTAPSVALVHIGPGTPSRQASMSLPRLRGPVGQTSAAAAVAGGRLALVAGEGPGEGELGGVADAAGYGRDRVVAGAQPVSGDIQPPAAQVVVASTSSHGQDMSWTFIDRLPSLPG